MVGSDWQGYEYTYRQYQACSKYDEQFEIGYKLLFSGFAAIGVDFWWFFIAGKVFCYAVFIKKLIKYTNGKYAWGLLFLYGYTFLYAFIDCPFRNLLAATIMICALDELLKGKTINFFLFTIISVTMHLSALLMCPVLFIVGKSKVLFNKKVIIFLIIAEFIAFTILWTTGLANQIQLAASLLFGDFKNTNYIIQKGSGFSIGLLAIVIIYIWTFLNIKEDQLNDSQKRICNLSIFYLFFYIGMYFIPMVNRFTLFFIIPFASTLAIGISQAKIKWIKQMALTLFFMFLCVSMKNTITKDYRYIPYSSYLQYIFREKPSYNYRINYNPTHSPYRDNVQEIEYNE